MANENWPDAAPLADRLHEAGHTEAAERVRGASTHESLGERAADAVLFTLREACEYVLTAIEALDPKTEAMAEELRLEVEKHLTR